MGVYVKGMKMPTEGEYNFTLYVCSDGSAYIDVALFPVDKDKFEVVPVPPHGDLIDRDALKKQGYFFPCAIGTEYAIPLRAVIEAPTIIPTEGE